MKTHHLKIQERYFFALLSGEKTAEVRFNDRDYQKGDILTFDIIYSDISDRPAGMEYEKWKVTHVLHYPEGLKDGYVVLSLKKIR